MASSVTSAQVSEANSLAMPASRSQRSPVSFLSAAWRVEQAGRLDLRRHVGQLELDRLVLADRLAEGLALLRVADRRLERGAGDADGARGDVDAADLEAVEDVLHAVSLSTPPSRFAAGTR